MSQRDNIPLPVQREVRQKCGFGCVVCGMPLFEYDHIVEWSKVKEHKAENLTLLCNKHHTEKTKGLLPKEKVIEATENPHNLKQDVSKPYDLHFSGDEAIIKIANCSFTTKYNGYGTELIPLSIDDTPLLAFIIGDDHLLLNLVLFDEFNSPILHIKNNELVYKPEPWDIEFKGTNLIIREAKRNIFIDIVFKPPNEIHIKRGKFLRNGVEVLIRPENILVTNNATFLSDIHGTNVVGGIKIGKHNHDFPSIIALEKINRYLGDRSDALEFEKEAQQETN